MARTREIENEQILESARKMLISKGLTVSVREIARAIGVSEGVVFQRFGSKAALIDAALAPPELDLDDVVTRAGGHADPARALEDVAAALFAALRQHASVSLAALDAGNRGAWRRPDGVFLACLRALTHYLRREQQAARVDAGPSDTPAFLLAGLLHHAAVFEAMGGPTPHVNEQAVRRMARVIWHGIAPAPPP